MLDFLYNTIAGRLILKILTAPVVSKVCGAFLDSPVSKVLIAPFVRANSIDLSQFYSDDFKCFNDCFARRIRQGMRPFDGSPQAFVSPCDGLLSAYRIREDTVLPGYREQPLFCSCFSAPKPRGRAEPPGKARNANDKRPDRPGGKRYDGKSTKHRTTKGRHGS